MKLKGLSCEKTREAKALDLAVPHKDICVRKSLVALPQERKKVVYC